MKTRRIVAVIAVLVGVGVWLAVNPASYETILTQAGGDETENIEADYVAEAVTEANENAPLATEM